MNNESYIRYLNSLHNVDAKNENAIAEASQNNPYFKDVMVKRPIVDFITNCLMNEEPHIILITGHAGDGKTSVLIQALDELQALQGPLNISDEVKLVNGNQCVYIKDFSEFSADERRSKLKECFVQTQNGKHVVLVANTGPLLNTFLEEMGVQSQMTLINAIDENKGDIIAINNCKIRAVNIAGIDNSSFAIPFLKNLVSEKCFEKCKECKKSRCCPILFNRNMILENESKIFDFLHNHFIWQQEHGKRLTIRQIIAQITFALTAGLDCKDVKIIDNKSYLFKHLFSNALFGYNGFDINQKASSIQAIEDIQTNGYDRKCLISDEDLFIRQDITALHPGIQELILDMKNHYSCVNSIKWNQALRRMYILFNIETNDIKNAETTKTVFSKKFPRYLELRNGKSPNNDDKVLIMEAFSILFVGYICKNIKELPITLNRGNGISQSVQLLLGEISNKYINLKTIDTGSNLFEKDQKKQLFIEAFGYRINQPISLPLLNYFEEIRSGAISTDISPQLTHGIDSIKAQMISLCRENQDSESIELLVMETKGYGNIKLQETDGEWTLLNY
ncbi:hypothetical protein RBG61_13115 [Paludicola sp. MB14-C6]|uniref:hypothetical protein n=1 Tax=Paludihabitans sp. MB14-C6 TaxID=3070656 RepID=UPI0027DDAA1A|nr:hypothetical protein [Paludicola sp. MB14-C6]WMJ22914.1 hypothetical protein RBG61_13115 [Paludicola sp. MB14-C6]